MCPSSFFRPWPFDESGQITSNKPARSVNLESPLFAFTTTLRNIEETKTILNRSTDQNVKVVTGRKDLWLNSSRSGRPQKSESRILIRGRRPFTTGLLTIASPSSKTKSPSREGRNPRIDKAATMKYCVAALHPASLSGGVGDGEVEGVDEGEPRCRRWRFLILKRVASPVTANDAGRQKGGTAGLFRWKDANAAALAPDPLDSPRLLTFSPLVATNKGVVIVKER